MFHYSANKNLSRLNTFGIDVSCRHFFSFEQEEDLESIAETPLLRSVRDQKSGLLVLGQGSNILFRNDYDGVVLKNEVKGIRIVEETSEYVLIEAGAGIIWNDLVQVALENNWAGIENLSLIPGTVGAAPVQNIGAYGAEASDCISYVKFFHLHEQAWITFDRHSCEFGYRDTIFKRSLKNKAVICRVGFLLSKTPRLKLSYDSLNRELEKRNITNPTIQAISEIICEIRRSKLPDPDILGNAGSFFMNPVVDQQKWHSLREKYPDIPCTRNDLAYKIPAGWLIERAGWKGYRENDAGCFEKQALILVNYGRATGGEIVSLSAKIRASVLQMFDIQLTEEVNIV
jgi:UDP-N-acetylmuramate dehydrogenase